MAYRLEELHLEKNATIQYLKNDYEARLERLSQDLYTFVSELNLIYEGIQRIAKNTIDLNPVIDHLEHLKK